MYGIDVFASNESPLRGGSMLVYGTSGMHVARLVHIRRVGDESTSKFSV